MFSRDKRQIEELNRQVALLKSQLDLVTRDRDLYKQLVQTWGGRALGILDTLCQLNEQVKTLAKGQKEGQKAVMADLQSLSDAIDAQGQTIQQEAQEVKNQLDQMTATINDLRNQVSPDVQPLVDRLAANTAAVQAIFTGETPPPAPTPEPGRGRR